MTAERASGGRSWVKDRRQRRRPRKRATGVPILLVPPRSEADVAVPAKLGGPSILEAAPDG